MKFTMNREILLDALNHVSKGYLPKPQCRSFQGSKLK